MAMTRRICSTPYSVSGGRMDGSGPARFSRPDPLAEIGGCPFGSEMARALSGELRLEGPFDLALVRVRIAAEDVREGALFPGHRSVGLGPHPLDLRVAQASGRKGEAHGAPARRRAAGGREVEIGFASPETIVGYAKGFPPGRGSGE